jgi:hypothetical protein
MPNRFMRLNFDFQTWGTSCRASETTRQYCIEAIAAHEFGHALGFLHEQDRSDNPDTLCADQEGTGTSGALAIFLTDYDPNSVMNYCNELWNNAGQLSAGDIQGLQEWYGETVLTALYARPFDGSSWGEYTSQRVGAQDNWRGWSWDGTTASYVAVDASGKTFLYIRPFDGSNWGEYTSQQIAAQDNWRG